MAQLGFFFDGSRCTGCKTCVVACKETHDLPVGKWGIRVFDDGPWQKDDSGEGGDCFNWNKIPVPTDLCDLCKVNVDVLNKLFKKEIEENQIQIHIECPEKPVMAEINIEQMNKALGSILKNSIYALLRKLQKQSFSPFITIKLEERGNNTVFISIYDNGIGIEDSIKDKIFEPFFTTKPSAEAAGVGLYLCREVILNHQGSILAKSEKDSYTEFLITIPISQKRINNE